MNVVKVKRHQLADFFQIIGTQETTLGSKLRCSRTGKAKEVVEGMVGKDWAARVA